MPLLGRPESEPFVGHSGVFLDDLTPADLAAALGTPVTTVEPDAPALLAALLGR